MLGILEKRTVRLTIMIGVLLLAAAARLFDLTEDGLWYDELQSVTHASQSMAALEQHETPMGQLPVPRLIKSALEFDPHPPLYYLQLHYWLLISSGERWIRLNSVLFSLLAVCLIMGAGRQLFDARVGIWAGVIFALAPMGIHYGQEVRMYSLLMLLALAAFYLTWRFFRQGASRGLALGVLLATTGCLYTHAAAFLLVLGLNCYAVLLWAENRRRRAALGWLVVQGGAAVLASPYLLRAATFTVTHPEIPTAGAALEHLGQLLLGPGELYSPAVQVAALLTATTLLLGGALAPGPGRRRHRQLLVSGLVVPIAACAAISLLGRPIWLVRAFAFTLPLLCLLLASSAARLSGLLSREGRRVWRARALPAALVLLTTLAGAHHLMRYRQPSGFREAAQWLKHNLKQGDLLQVPHLRDFWGMVWYQGHRGRFNPTDRRGYLVQEGGVVMASAVSGPLLPWRHGRHWVVGGCQRQAAKERGRLGLRLEKKAGPVCILRRETGK